MSASTLAELNRSIGWVLAESRKLFNGEVDDPTAMAAQLSHYRTLMDRNAKDYRQYVILNEGYTVAGGEKVREHLRYEEIVAQMAEMRGLRSLSL